MRKRQVTKTAKKLLARGEAEAIRIERYRTGRSWHVLLGWNDTYDGEVQANWRLIAIGKTIDDALWQALERDADDLHDYRIGAVAYLPGSNA